VDYVSPSPQFSKQQVIPGIFIRGSVQAAKLIAANADFQDLTPVVRVFVPGNANATVTVQVVGATAKTFGTVVRSTVTAGSVADLEITGLKDGNYVALVSADVEVQSAVRLSRITETAGPDFTWIPAAEKFTGKRNLTVPSAGISKLCIYNEKTGAIEVLELSPGSTYSFAVSENPIYANLITDINGTVANLSVLDQKNAGGKVSVSVR
jgi:molybdopterin-binding protein